MGKIKVGLLVEEFFDRDLGGYGGYGILARQYIGRYLPDEKIELEVIIGSNNKKETKTIIRDNIKIHYLPKNWSSKYDIDFLYLKRVKEFFKKEKFDIYLSIEMSRIAYEVMRLEKDKKLILWVQDPRPKEDWEEIKTVPMSSEYDSYINYYSKWEERIKKLLNKLNSEGRLKIISQGKYLMKKAKKLYTLPGETEMTYFPNPVEIEDNFSMKSKKNSIIFLGRLTGVKRPWIYYEVAKLLPEYTFYVCGQGELESDEDKYKNVKNLKFMGHVSGKEKERLLQECKVLVNTSIHEAIPVSFLEAISYGLYIVSCQNPDDITSNYGKWTGTILGDGLKEVNKFKEGIEECIKNYNENELKAGIEYIKENHSISKFEKNIKNLITLEVRNGK